jgi:hypothetical protein
MNTVVMHAHLALQGAVSRDKSTRIVQRAKSTRNLCGMQPSQDKIVDGVKRAENGEIVNGNGFPHDVCQ